MRMWRLKTSFSGSKDWDYLTTRPSGGYHLKLFAGTVIHLHTNYVKKKRRASQRRCYLLSPSTSLRKQHLLSTSKARKWKLALYNSCRCRLPGSQSSSLLLQESKNSQLLWSTGSLLGAVTNSLKNSPVENINCGSTEEWCKQWNLQKEKNLCISGDIRDGSDQRLWMSLIFSKMEQRGQKERMLHSETARMRRYSE